MKKIKELYWLRFSDGDRKQKERLWRVLCRGFLQRYVGSAEAVLDLGSGSCEFINNIKCGRKFAVDINDDIRKFAQDNVKFFISNSADMKDIPSESVDIVFASELFEHLQDTEELFATFLEIYRVLKKGGRLITICPNIRFLADKYWDFIDHRLPLSHVSMKEGLMLYNFQIIKIIAKFLPYTTKSALPKSPLLLKIYLKLPFLWKIFGRQMFIIARK